MVGGMAHAVHLHDTGACQTASATKQVDAGVSEPALLAGIGVVRDHEVPPRKRSVDVDLRQRGRLVCGVRGLAGAQQRFGRNACPVRALAADEFALDQRDTQAAFGEGTRAMLAG